MIEVLSVVAVSAAIFLVAGITLALCLRARDDGWAPLLTDALGYGLLLSTLAVTFNLWFGIPGVVLLGLLWLGAAVFAVVRRVGLPSLWRPRGRDWLLVGTWVAVIVGALLLRLRDSNFIPWVGDMGAYVNWANEYVRLGEFKATWPPFFPAFLTISSAIFGPELTTAAVPFTGILLVLVVARVARQLGAGPWSAVVAGGLVGVSVPAIWFSVVPGSEALNAPLFILWLGSIAGVLTAERARLPWWLAASGLGMLALGLLRGTAPLLLLPLLIFAVVAMCTTDWRAIAQRLWLGFSVSLVGALVSYWYGIQRIPRYYVDTQIEDLVPGALFRLLQRSGIFTPTVGTALFLVFLTGVLFVLGLYFARRVEYTAAPSRAPKTLGYIVGGVLILGIGVDGIVNAEVWQNLLRAGLWLTVIAVALIFFIGKAKLRADVSALVLTSGMVMALFIAIHTYRLKIDRDHAYFLYWDRYLFSEVIPLLFLLLAVALTAAWKLGAAKWVATQFASGKPVRRAIPAVVVAALLAVAVVPSTGQIAIATKHGAMDGAYEFEQELIAMLPDETTPIVWAGSRPDKIEGFFFPNTWMAFAKPMARTFGYNVVNISDRGNDFAPDELVDAASLAKDASCASSNSLVVFETQVGGPSLDERITYPGFELTELGQATGEILMVSQPATNGDWTSTDIPVEAWLVEISDQNLLDNPCAA